MQAKGKDRIRPVEKVAYRVPEAVAAYGLSRTKIYELIQAGVLRTAKVGGCTLIPREALDALIGGTQGAA